jgi:hypothetical protein
MTAPAAGAAAATTAPSAAAAAAAAAPATQKATDPPLLIRPYDHACDHPEIERICEHVYGGTDYLPRVIAERAAREDTVILSAEAVEAVAAAAATAAAAAATAAAGGKAVVAASSSAGGGDDSQADQGRSGPRLHGTVCAHMRGDGTAFVSGLRVCPDARGQGIGRLLMVSVGAG